MRYLYTLFAGFSVLLNGCMVGPNFHSPKGPQTRQYIQGQSAERTIQDKASGASGKIQYFQMGRDIPAEWWRVFRSPGINTLIGEGIAHNPTLAAANAALRVARENYTAQIGTLFPVITANFSALRERLNAASVNRTAVQGTFNLFNTNLAAVYTLDVFGGLRRQIEAVGAQVDFQQFELESAFLTLSSNIVNTAITIASLRAQIKATGDLIAAQQKTLRIVNGQFNLGSASKADILLQQTQLASTIATLPPLKQSLDAQYHYLSILIGALPREDNFPVFNLNALHLPADLPASCPSLLTRQRPDVRAAEALLHAASAQIGVATANFFPQVVLSGNYGVQSNFINTLFSPGSKIWNIEGSVAQTLFQGGTLIAQRRAAIAAYQQAAAQYRQTVLQAFQNVSDTLRALQHDAELLKALKEVETTSRNALTLTQAQFQLGGASFLDLLIAQRTYQLAVIDRIQAQAARYADTAALFQALGGGWWNHKGLKGRLNRCKKESISCKNQ